MYSIRQEDEYLKCPNCPNVIASFSPTCDKCGFITGEQGVVELAHIERDNAEAVMEARELFDFIAVSSALLMIGHLIAFFAPQASLLVIVLSICCSALFWVNFVGWRRKHSNIEFPDEGFYSARRSTNKAATLGIAISFLTVVLIYRLIAG